ncbi:MAG: STAS domain-containing protein [Acidimicrobiales bacterium]
MRGSVVVSVVGEVDIATTTQLSEALCEALRSGAKRLVCDLSEVGFLDASGLRALLVSRRRALECDAVLDLVCPQALPRRVIGLTGVDTVVPCHDSVAEAVDAQEQRAIVSD